MSFQFDSVYERDMDFLFMRKLAQDKAFVRKFFLECKELAEKHYDKADFTVEKVAHSVTTEDGESDIEVILSVDGKRIALLIEDKIDAVAQPEQAERYNLRGQKTIERGDYDEFYVFIVAPQAYLNRNAEAGKYPHQISYEDILESTEDKYEKAVISYALSAANVVRLPRSTVVTEFWDELYDYLDENYPGVFRVHGHRGLERSAKPGQWITISCSDPFQIQIKSDRGFVDLELRGYTEKFAQFSKDNQALIEDRRLYIRTATESLAIREYIPTIDFTKTFDSQTAFLKIAFDAAKKLQDMIPHLKLR